MSTKFWCDVRKSRVIEMLDKEKPMKDILEQLNISERSYYYYLKEIREKLYSKDMVQHSIDSVLGQKNLIIEKCIESYHIANRNDKANILKLLFRAVESRESTLQSLGVLPKNIKYKIIKSKEE